MPLPRYLPHLLYATAITSFSLHLLAQRKTGADTRLRLDAHIGILEEINGRLRRGEDVKDEEIERTRRLMREEGAERLAGGGIGGAGIGWKEVILGRKTIDRKSEDVQKE
ncbi:hypothetical protein BD410DRAFT_512471 [Rickenella mellea]|uniref:Uncharacterized protein n=1 Tax=Rickenella mellea TaxID=50990 RepID=A0A4Y7PTZ0_9AGAM|nr:hypothetical protein BD410DRAFT_512471 [Rickenella mellea]